MMQKPDVEHIDGLSPAISIEQKTTSRNPRSTVATVTEIYDYMRLLWARVGVPYSPATGLPIEAQQVSQMVDRVMALPEGSRHYLLAPVVRGRKGEYRKELAEWQKAGFTRVRIDGEFYAIEDAPALDKKYKHDIEVVVDRIVVREGIETRLADSFETALKLADGLAYLDPADPPSPSARSRRTPRSRHRSSTTAPPGRIVFSEKFACPVSRLHHRRDRAAAVQLQRPAGRLPGVRRARREAGVRRGPRRPQPRRSSIKQGRGRALGQVQPALALITCRCSARLARAYDFDLETPWNDLPEEAQRRRPPRHRAAAPSRSASSTAASSYEVKKPFEGVIGNLNRRMLADRVRLDARGASRTSPPQPCEVCHGARLKPEALA